MPQTLPAGANLDQLRAQAKDLLRDYKSGRPAAVARVGEYFRSVGAPGVPTADAGDASARTAAVSAPAPLRLSQAQLVVAREYGFSSWPRLKKHVDSLTAAGRLKDAINRDDLDEVRKLIAGDPTLMKAPIGYGGGGPLIWAAECRGPATPPSDDRLAIARFLLAAGADIHEDGDGPLMRACLNDGRIPMVELLVDAGADVNAFWRGTYPILWAPCETLAPRLIAWLLAHGADPNTPNPAAPDGGTPLDMVVGTYSRSSHQQECAELLVNAGGRCRFDGLPSIDIHRGRLDLLEERIRADPSLVHRRFPEFDYGSTAQSALTLKGATLLHVAASYGDTNAARVLLDAGADPDGAALVDENGIGGQTPLFHAVAQYFDFGVPVARLLIENGASLSVRARVPGRYDYPDESLEVTPLGFAARFPDEPVRCVGAEKLLLDYSAPAGDVYAAARLGLSDELRALLAAGGDPNMKNLDGVSALQAATDGSHEEACRLLRAAGAIDAP